MVAGDYTLWVFDVDGVLVDNTPRSHLMPPVGQCATTQDWDAFNGACHLDVPVIPMVDMFNRIASGASNHVVLLTSRGALARNATLCSLDALGADVGMRKKILMRPVDDNRGSGDVKRDLLATYLYHAENELGITYRDIVFVDDDPANLEAVHDLITLAVHVDGPCCARLRSKIQNA